MEVATKYSGFCLPSRGSDVRLGNSEYRLYMVHDKPESKFQVPPYTIRSLQPPAHSYIEHIYAVACTHFVRIIASHTKHGKTNWYTLNKNAIGQIKLQSKVIPQMHIELDYIVQ